MGREMAQQLTVYIILAEDLRLAHDTYVGQFIATGQITVSGDLKPYSDPNGNLYVLMYAHTHTHTHAH